MSVLYGGVEEAGIVALGGGSRGNVIKHSSSAHVGQDLPNTVLAVQNCTVRLNLCPKSAQ